MADYIHTHPYVYTVAGSAANNGAASSPVAGARGSGRIDGRTGDSRAGNRCAAAGLLRFDLSFRWNLCSAYGIDW